MKNIFLITVAVIMSGMLQGQQKTANISFNEMRHDFGNISEASGSVTYDFVFINTGSQPLIISNVSASCGCTSPTWSKAPVMPGAEGFVKATYNPANRPGKFEKTITVTSNGSEGSIILRIAGDVTPKQLSISEQYPQTIGDLRLRMKQVNFGKINPGQVKKQELDLVNTGNQPVKITFKNVPAHLSVSVQPQTINAGDRGKILIVYSADAKKDWGYSTDQFNVVINGTVPSDGVIAVTSIIEEDFSALSPAQKANAPQMVIPENTFNFGQLNKGQKADHEFVIQNEGKSNLVIRKLTPSCGCTAVNTSSNTIEPGHSGTIKVSFDSRGKSGEQNTAITLVTNDPQNFKTILWVRGQVVN